MIILDANVVSEPMRSRADPKVTAWLDRQAADTLYLTATSLSELLVAVELLPAGRRRDGLAGALAEILASLFGTRILPFDERAAVAYAALVGRARATGRPLSVGDGQIAAIASVHGFAVATREVAPFTAADLTVIDPWNP
ncbi:MAG: type II toxin-antitoxin system VapC family toxin [Caulobacteraceae bacterium]